MNDIDSRTVLGQPLGNIQPLFIAGSWINAVEGLDKRDCFELVNPATELPHGKLILANSEDVNDAVDAAQTAFETFSLTSVDERIGLLKKIISVYQDRSESLSLAICREIGAPISLARNAHVMSGLKHLECALEALKSFGFEASGDGYTLYREPIGVCALITPWNWPLNQMLCKVAAALATACTMIVKPSEYSSASAVVFTEILQEAGVPDGVFNLLGGDHRVGAALASHPGVDMVSFTGSSRGGVAVAQSAAPSIKRVSQELGGKSACIVFDDADIEAALKFCVNRCFSNSGQSCNAPTRLLLPRSLQETLKSRIKQLVLAKTVANPVDLSTDIGPVVNHAQYRQIQEYIQIGIEEDAELLVGGVGRPEGMSQGFYVRPTVFVDVGPGQRIAQEEIFGPVLCVIPYDSDDEAITVANDSPYGLASYVFTSSEARKQSCVKKLRVGMVHINGSGSCYKAPFGGYKMSGNGREWGELGFEEYLETKSVMGA